MKNTFRITVGLVKSSPLVKFPVSRLAQPIFGIVKKQNNKRPHTLAHRKKKTCDSIRLFVLVLLSIAALAFLWHLLYSGFFN